MSKVTVYIGQDEWWPWHHFTTRGDGGEAVTVDRETADRWAVGLAAAEALQDEIAAACEAAKR